MPWRYLRSRPLAVPTIPAGAPCPATTTSTQIGGYPVLGPGPAAPILTYNTVRVEFRPPPEFGTEWSGFKRVWFVNYHYFGRVLLRGHQLDGDGEVRFVDGRPGFTPQKLLNPVPEYLMQGAGSFPSLTRVRTPGCYAYQLDGRAFSYLVVFQVVAK